MLNHWMPLSGSDIYFALEIFGIIYAIIAVIWFTTALYNDFGKSAIHKFHQWNKRRKYLKMFNPKYRRFLK